MAEEDIRLGEEDGKDETVDIVDTEGDVDVETDPNLSALRDNIKSKGKNSYYYAHGSKVDGPVWDNNPEPRLLSRESVAKTKADVTPEAISSYAWLDETAKVKVYVTVPGVGELPDENITMEWTATSLSVRVDGTDGSARLLALPALYESIEGAKLRKKADKLIITLTKSAELTWSALKKSA